eukprot:6067346-Pyramimonas_sp.AAC.1
MAAFSDSYALFRIPLRAHRCVPLDRLIYGYAEVCLRIYACADCAGLVGQFGGCQVGGAVLQRAANPIKLHGACIRHHARASRHTTHE